MRIVAGKFKGRNIIPPDDYEVRPTSAMVREAIFGKLQFMLSGAKFIDLFAGSGAMGIEALSRGAGEVIFNDSSRKSCKLIERNLKSIEAESRIINMDYSACLKALKDYEAKFIFADPPYALDCIDNILEIAVSHSAIMLNGIVIYEHLREKPLKVQNNHYIIMDEKHYSSTTVSYIKRIL